MCESYILGSRLAELRAAAAERARTMSSSPDTPEEIAERAELVEAMWPLQAAVIASMGED